MVCIPVLEITFTSNPRDKMKINHITFILHIFMATMTFDGAQYYITTSYCFTFMVCDCIL